VTGSAAVNRTNRALKWLSRGNAVALFGLCAACCAEHAPSKGAAVSQAARRENKALGALRVYRDHFTGKFAPPPAAHAASAGPAAVMATPGVVERASVHGGFVVTLPGNLSSSVRAVARSDGGLSVNCDPPPEMAGP
jgi:hypothetical protein